MSRTWALGDIHANATALSAALELIEPGDPLVILGDLLTYGPDPCEVLELVLERVVQGAVLVLGNHDELYLDLLRGETGYRDRLPAWIQASADWTLDRLDPATLRRLPFVREHVASGVLFAHANPWGDWRYLNRDEDHHEAAEVLRRRGLKIGIFGHTHRSRIVELPPGRGLGDGARRELRWRPGEAQDVLLINAGSVGQPRDRAATSTLVELQEDASGIAVRLHEVRYDVGRHLSRLSALPLSTETLDRLASFFHPSPRAP
ncbi:MAG TPA: metallophosphatase family protein [Deltaproteobacteria bacterium]|nr:metallophosphatase family protein [Deltaproteobacteria bacterium]